MAEKQEPELGRRNIITSASGHRALLIGAMEALIEGRINVPQANALAGLSAEVHKSIRQEWDMECYAAEHFALASAKILMLEPGDGVG